MGLRVSFFGQGSGFRAYGLGFDFLGFGACGLGFGRGADLGLLLVVQKRDARAEELVEIEPPVREEADAPAKQYPSICQQLDIHTWVFRRAISELNSLLGVWIG